MTHTLPISLLRLVIGIGLLGSVVWQVTDRIANNVFRPTEYFAYFSIVTSIVAGIVMLITAVRLLTRLEDGKWFEIARLSLAVAMIVLAVVYHLLLADMANDIRDGDYAWPVMPNEIIHTYAPILAAIEYLISVKAFKIRLRAFLWVAIYPLAWLTFSVIRGLLTGWWPYWFLNPGGEIGLIGMLGYVGAITVFFLSVGFTILSIKILIRKLIRVTP